MTAESAVASKSQQSEPQHIGDLVPPGLLRGEPLGGLEGAVNERVTVGGHVRQLQPLTQRREVDGVAADLIAHADRLHADLAALARDVIAVSAERELLARLASG